MTGLQLNFWIWICRPINGLQSPWPIRKKLCFTAASTLSLLWGSLPFAFIITLPSAYVPRLLAGTYILNNTYLFHLKHSLLWFHYIRDIILLYPHILALKNIECYIKAFQTFITTIGYFPEDAITEEKFLLVVWHIYRFTLTKGNQSLYMLMSYVLS